MNKLTSTLAGLALAATASVVPAFAQGNLFSPPGTFTFTGLGTPAFSAFTLPGQFAEFNPLGTTTQAAATFTLTGTQVSPGSIYYNLTSLTVTPVTAGAFTAFTEGPLAATSGGVAVPLEFSANTAPNGFVSVASVGAATDGTTFNLVNPIPEASTVVSFGALLALGGLAVLRRKSVKNAA